MNDITKRGKLWEQAGDTIYIRDTHISNIVKNALRDNGFDLVVRQKVESNTNCFIGEDIEIFREII
jgi:hypothetical protein